MLSPLLCFLVRERGGEHGAGWLLRSSGGNREQTRKEWGFVSGRRDLHDVLMM